MLSTDDLENIITLKKREIEKEKTLLGIGLPPTTSYTEDDKENDQVNPEKQVSFKENPTEISCKERRILSEQNESTQKEESHKDLRDFEEKIPPDLERYIRRYIGIPAMLKAGEYSPNNPILRAELNSERDSGDRDALLGLGEYERRRNTLRKIRQAQYRQYLDQQAKKNQEAKEEAERERREREEKERQREERERQLLLEREKLSPERRRASVCTAPVSHVMLQPTKVDTGVQVDGLTTPLSVAVQTDDVELYRLSGSPGMCLTQAERELSPRTVGDSRQPWPRAPDGRRRSYGDFDERTSTIKKSNRDKLVSDLRHSYMPSIFDADAVHMRNLQAEKEAAARRQFYQQELKNQILEQQRIREERKSREKMLEQAEMRRLEEQLRMLRVAQEREIDKQHDISTAMKDNAKDYDIKRTELQREIDMEQQKILRATAQPRHNIRHATTRHNTSKSDTPRSKLPFYYNTEKTFQPIENEKGKKPYSFNIPDNSVFSANYDVDSYLRKNLNFRDKIDRDIENIGSTNNSQFDNTNNRQFGNNNNQFANTNNSNFGNTMTNQLANANNKKFGDNNSQFGNTNNNVANKNKDQRNIVIEKALIHEPKKQSYDDLDNISIPVLRHSPKTKQISAENSTNLSDAMKKVDDKWKVPAVQKNILKSLPNDEGKNINILTQLGSIRRQLQLEQLKLDKMLPDES